MEREAIQGSGARRWWRAGLVVAALACADAHGQSVSLSGGGQGTPEVPEVRQQSPGLDELMDSVGSFLTGKMREVFGFRTGEETRWDSTESPRDAVFTFIQGMETMVREGGDSGARVRRTLAPGFSENGEEALALWGVFQRLGELSPVDLPDKIALEGSSLAEFEVFPYAVDHQWVWEYLEEAPRGTIVLVRSDGGWVFSRETLEGAPELLRAMFDIPPEFAMETGKPLVEQVFAPIFRNSPWWSWLVLCGALVLAYFLGKSTRRGILKWGDYLEAKTKPLVGSMVRNIATAVAILVGTVTVIAGGAAIEFTPLVATLHWHVIKLVLLVALVWVVVGVTDLVATIVRKHLLPEATEYGEMAVTLIQRVFRSFLFVVLAVFLLENLFGMNIGALVTGLGIVGLALSLAGKETAQNLFGAVSIFMNRPFVVGDLIEFKGELGTVTDVRMQATYVRLLSGEMLIVPNMQFISNAVENLSMRKYLRRELELTLPYRTSPERVGHAVELLDEILRRDEIVEDGRCDLERHPPRVSFVGFGSYSLNVRAYYWYYIGEDGEELDRNSERGWYSYLDHGTLVNRTILEEFEKEGLEFAFPTQTLEIGNPTPGIGEE